MSLYIFLCIAVLGLKVFRSGMDCILFMCVLSILIIICVAITNNNTKNINEEH